MPSNNFQAIIFDLDGTLRHNDPPAIAVFHQLASEHGISPAREQEREAVRWIYAYWADSPELQTDLETYGDWDGNGAFWTNHARRHLLQLGASKAHAHELAPVITQRMQEEYQPVDCIPEDVFPTLSHLKQHGYALAVVSNRSKPFDAMMAELGLDDFMQFSLAAGKVGIWKPDPRLLLHAASKIGAAPQEIIYVGDNYFADVVCAKAAGMMPVLMDPDGLFPDAECKVISRIGDLPQALAR